jgi:hypothetical protein
VLKAGAQRRAQLAKKAEPKENLGLVGSIVKGILSVTNRIGVTGSTTRVVQGKIVVTRNPIQQLTALIYAILHVMNFLMQHVQHYAFLISLISTGNLHFL